MVPGPRRPDQTRRAQSQPKTTAQATNKQKKEKRQKSAHKAPEQHQRRGTPFRRKTRMKKRVFPQMLENKAPEHPKCPPKSPRRFLVVYKPRLKMQASQHSKKRGRISRERTAPEYQSHRKPRLKIVFLVKKRQMLKNKAPESK